MTGFLSGPMGSGSLWLLLLGLVAIGVLHTLIPDHWVPITLVARQNGWSIKETRRMAFMAGSGHVLTTLALGVVVWFAGQQLAERFGRDLNIFSSVGLMAFGGWIAISSWWALRKEGHRHPHGDGLWHSHGAVQRISPETDPLYRPMTDPVVLRHVHRHRHDPDAPPHEHWHDHGESATHWLSSKTETHPPLHDHRHRRSKRTSLLLILGSSPMVEGIPVFFAAGKMGMGVILLMSVVFAASTIGTYVLLCTYSAKSMHRISLGPIERYGEVLSGFFIAILGGIFWFFPVL